MSNATVDVKATRVKVPCRISYANIWSPKAINEGDTPKYSVALLISPEDKKTLEKIEAGIQAAYALGKTKLANSKGVMPAIDTIKRPLRDADAEGIDDDAYAGKLFMNANSSRKPQIVDRQVEAITDPDEVYSGCYCNVTVNFYAYNVNGNKGIAAGLGNIQKLKDGERLSGGASASEDFEDEGEDEDFLG